MEFPTQTIRPQKWGRDLLVSRHYIRLARLTHYFVSDWGLPVDAGGRGKALNRCLFLAPQSVTSLGIDQHGPDSAAAPTPRPTAASMQTIVFCSAGLRHQIIEVHRRRTMDGRAIPHSRFLANPVFFDKLVLVFCAESVAD